MFHSDHFVQFLYANENERYFPNCMMETDLQLYLWYQLQKDRFDTAFFLNHDSSGCTVETYDPQSAEQFLRHGSSVFAWFLGGKAAKEYHSSFRETKPDSIRKWITESAEKKGKKQAFIMPLDCFCYLFDGAPQEKFLKQLVSSAGSHDNSILFLLLAPLTEPDAADQMLGKTSIFCRSYQEQMLCDSLDLIRSAEPEYLFRSLEQNLGSSFIRLDRVDYEMISNILLSRALRHPEACAAPGQIEKQAAFLSDWCADSSLQMRYDLGWQPGSAFRYRTLKEKLEDAAFYAQMDAVSRDYSAHGEAHQAAPLREDALSRSIRKMELPKSFLMWSTEENAVLEQFRAFQQSVSEFWTQPQNSQVAAMIRDRLLPRFREAVTHEDWATLNDIVTLLEFCGKHICIGKAREDRFLEICRQFEVCVIDQSVAFFLLKKQEAELKAELNDLQGSAREKCQFQLDVCTVQCTQAHKFSTEKRMELKPFLWEFDRSFDQQNFLETLKKVNQDIADALSRKLETISQQRRLNPEKYRIADALPDIREEKGSGSAAESGLMPAKAAEHHDEK